MHDPTEGRKSSRPDHRKLFGIASEQAGFFTATQAASCGFSRASLSYHGGRGRFLRIKQGLYRFTEYPASPREEVVAAWISAGRDKAFVSHESALDLHGLSDVVPERVHLTVSRSRRYRTSGPGVAIHTTIRPVSSNDIVIRQGVRVTSPTRSIVDVAQAGTDPEHVLTAVRQAIRRGLTTPTQLRTEARGRGARVKRLIDRALADAEAEADSR